MYSSNYWEISKSINISEFPSDVLIRDLYRRIEAAINLDGRNIQSDLVLDSMNITHLKNLLNVLREST
jgi:hypothetical protein